MDEALTCCGVVWVSDTMVVPGMPPIVGAESKFYADFLMACCAFVVGDRSVY